MNLLKQLTVPILGQGGIIPGAKLKNKVQLPIDLPPGQYVLQINYQYGTEANASIRRPFRIDKAFITSKKPPQPKPKPTPEAKGK
jgi:hypothetical protein